MAQRTLAVLAAAALAAAASAADISVVRSSATGETWAPQPGLSWGPDFSSKADVTIDAGAVRQNILGFGSCLQDTSAYNAMVWMNSSIFDEFLEAYWGPSGLGYTWHRITLNSADYSFQSFNYDNVTDDFSLAHFDHNISYDKQRVIPLIEAVKKKSADPLHFFASPWSPPPWMKVNGNMIDSALPCLKNDTAQGQSYKQAWADYIVQWLKAYEAAGIPMDALTPQNEPEAQQKAFESCAYHPSDMVDFVAGYLGPAVKAAYPSLQILGWDHNKIDSLVWAQALLGNSTSSSYLDGMAFHWYDYEHTLGLDNVQSIAQMLAARPQGGIMLATEACYLQSLYETWSTGELYGVDILGDLNFGMQGWVQWSTVLLTGDMYPWWRGGPNHDNTTNFGNGLLFEYNASGTQRLIYQPSYWVMGHVSRFARPGSHRVTSGGAGVARTPADYDVVRAKALGQPTNGTAIPLVASAFLSTDDSTVSVVVMNPSDNAVAFKLRDSTVSTSVRAALATLPAHSIATYTFTANKQ